MGRVLYVVARSVNMCASLVTVVDVCVSWVLSYEYMLVLLSPGCVVQSCGWLLGIEEWVGGGLGCCLCVRIGVGVITMGVCLGLV